MVGRTRNSLTVYEIATLYAKTQGSGRAIAWKNWDSVSLGNFAERPTERFSLNQFSIFSLHTIIYL